MIINRKETVPRYERDMIESFLLISAKTSGSEKLTVTMVEIQPEGFQRIHSHEPEQMYYIIVGSGMMYVDGEEKLVKTGDCIFFKSNSKHGLRNTGKSILRYMSAASPSFSIDACTKAWPLSPKNKRQ